VTFQAEKYGAVYLLFEYEVLHPVTNPDLEPEQIQPQPTATYSNGLLYLGMYA
jgi:hypothetical protein